MIAFSTLLARRLILIKWKDKFPPAFNHWVKDLMNHLVLEKIRYSVQGCASKFDIIWQPVITLVKRMDSTDII